MAIETEWRADRACIIEEDNLIESLKCGIRRKLGPAAKSPLTLTSCIFKVPDVLRRHKPEAYEPDVISIGPFHRKKFPRMETVKQWYLKTLLSSMNTSSEKFIDAFEEFLVREENKHFIEFWEGAREFYEEPLDLTHGEFMEMMILDGCFVIQLVRNKLISGREEKKDPILSMDCMFQYVCHDLLLLENQLPCSVLSCLYRFTWNRDPRFPPQFIEALLHAFLKLEPLDQYLQPIPQVVPSRKDEFLHILDIIRTSIVFGFRNERETKNKEPDKNEFWSEFHSATALSQVGVRFKKSSESDANLLEIKFEKGVLTIPKLVVGELTETLFRNLIAFEQCYHPLSHEITSYAIFMDKLISTEEDIEILSKDNIISNWLGVEDGYKLFNKLYAGTTLYGFQYDELCAKLHDYYKLKWHTYFAQLKRDYFSSPWKIIALAVAILVLVVTLSQFSLSLLPSPFTGIRVRGVSADI